jgi:hypothetical protein
LTGTEESNVCEQLSKGLPDSFDGQCTGQNRVTFARDLAFGQCVMKSLPYEFVLLHESHSGIRPSAVEMNSLSLQRMTCLNQQAQPRDKCNRAASVKAIGEGSS